MYLPGPTLEIRPARRQSCLNFVELNEAAAAARWLFGCPCQKSTMVFLPALVFFTFSS